MSLISSLKDSTSVTTSVYVSGSSLELPLPSDNIVRSWIGKRLWIQWHLRGVPDDIKQKEITSLYQQIFKTQSNAEQVWDFWCLLAQKGVSLKSASNGLKIWQLNTRSYPGRSCESIISRVERCLKIYIRAMSLYFGINSRYYLSFNSYWDTAQRFESLKQLISIIFRTLISIVQATFFVAKVASWFSLPAPLIIQATLIIAIASSIFAFMTFFSKKFLSLLSVPPFELPLATCLLQQTAQVQTTRLCLAVEDLKIIISALSRATSPIIMLHGPAGSGKNCRIEELARRMNQNQVPQHFKAKRLFLLPAAELTQTTDFKSPIDKLNLVLEQMKGFEEQIILVIDECHLLESNIIEKLKSAKSNSHLKIVMLTNATEELLKGKWNESFKSLSTHCEWIQVQDKNKEVLKEITLQYFKRDFKLHLLPKSEEFIADEFASQDGAPRKLLEELHSFSQQALEKKNRTNEESDLQIEIDELEEQCKELRNDDRFEESKNKLIELELKYKKLEEIQEKQKIIKQQLQTIENFHHKKNQLRQKMIHLISSNQAENSWIKDLITTIESAWSHSADERSQGQNLTKEELPPSFHDKQIAKWI
jgi:Cdc6-like AAA superfamily ATPase